MPCSQYAECYVELMNRDIKNPVVLITDSNWQTADEHLIHYATETGALFLDGMGDGICLGMTSEAYDQYCDNKSVQRKKLSSTMLYS